MTVTLFLPLIASLSRMFFAGLIALSFVYAPNSPIIALMIPPPSVSPLNSRSSPSLCSTYVVLSSCSILTTHLMNLAMYER